MSNSSSYPGWAYMLAGLALGLFIAFLLYLHNLPEVEINNATKRSNSEGTPPKFDFYTILPELEVVIPDLETVKDKFKQPEATPETPTKLSDGESFMLQVGSFKEIEQADRLKANLALLGFEAHLQKVKVNNSTWHRVRLGPFNDHKKLQDAKQRLKANSMQAITLKVTD